MGYSDLDPAVHEGRPWNAGQNVGPKRPLKPRDIWAIRFYLDEHRRLRDRALFDLAIDSKLRGCDLVKIRIGDVTCGGTIRNRSTVIQQKTGRPVQFEIMTEARRSLTAWLERRHGAARDFLFPSRVDYLGHLSTRQFARLVDEWVYIDSVMRQNICSQGLVDGMARSCSPISPSTVSISGRGIPVAAVWRKCLMSWAPP